MEISFASVRRAGLGGLVFGALVLGTVTGASAAGSQRIDVRDDCDPTTFNQVLGAGACVGNGGTTFTEFINRLTKDRSVGAWRNNPDHLSIDKGTSLQVVNRGGETHTFTCVTQFGGGFVDLLNQLSGNTTPAVLCPGQPLHQLSPGASFTASDLAPGDYKFQCLIHPWMRTTLTVKAS